MTTSATVVTHERFQLDFFVDPASWVGAFDQLEVWRSRGTELGPYEALHDDSWSPARLPLDTWGDPPLLPVVGPSMALSGKKLQFLVNERTPVKVTFSGSDPLTFKDAATQIQAASGGLLTSFVLPEGVLVVETVAAGLKMSLRCVGGDAAPLLGLPTTEPGSLAFGRDARLVLSPTVQSYAVIDPNGSPSYFYKARFYDSVAHTVSRFSSPFKGSVPVGLSTSDLCRCYVDLVDVTGVPAANQEVLIYNAFNGQQVAGRTVVGGSERLLTDSTGHAEVFLARGSKITVTIGGTPLARDFVVPTDPSIASLNLLADNNGTNDLFTVQIPNIPYAVRRTL